jgi:hypothetical protein
MRVRITESEQSHAGARGRQRESGCQNSSGVDAGMRMRPPSVAEPPHLFDDRFSGRRLSQTECANTHAGCFLLLGLGTVLSDSLENLCGLCIMQTKPVEASPTKHAANRSQCKHAKVAIERPQFGWYEFERIAARALAPYPHEMRHPAGPRPV